MIKIIRVAKGEAPHSANRVIIDHARDCYQWTGNVDTGSGTATFGASPCEYQSANEAEAAAIAWAVDHGATELMIETDDA